MDQFWKIIYIFLAFSMGVFIISHAKGFASAAGTLFSGVQGLGTTLEGANIQGGMGT